MLNVRKSEELRAIFIHCRLGHWPVLRQPGDGCIRLLPHGRGAILFFGVDLSLLLAELLAQLEELALLLDELVQRLRSQAVAGGRPTRRLEVQPLEKLLLLKK